MSGRRRFDGGQRDERWRLAAMRKSCRESGDADEDLLNGQNLRCLSACPHLRIARRGFLRVAQLWNGAAANPGHTLHHDGMGSRMRRFSLLFYRTVLPVVPLQNVLAWTHSAIALRGKIRRRDCLRGYGVEGKGERGQMDGAGAGTVFYAEVTRLRPGVPAQTRKSTWKFKIKVPR